VCVCVWIIRAKEKKNKRNGKENDRSKCFMLFLLLFYMFDDDRNLTGYFIYIYICIIFRTTTFPTSFIGPLLSPEAIKTTGERFFFPLRII